MKEASTFKQQVFEQLNLTSRRAASGLTITNRFIVFLIFIGLLLSIFQTEQVLHRQYQFYFYSAEWFLTIVFGLEYFLRLWVIKLEPRYADRWGRLRYALTPGAIIDLLSFLPTLIALFVTDAYLLRILRLMRILRIAKLGKYWIAMDMIKEVFRRHGTELVVAIIITFILLVCSSTLLYLCEREAQPDVFGSIPRAIWFVLVSLTTVGYGDVVPLTLLGKIVSGFIALLGVGIVALPAGILAAGFTDVYREQRLKKKVEVQVETLKSESNIKD